MSLIWFLHKWCKDNSWIIIDWNTKIEEFDTSYLSISIGIDLHLDCAISSCGSDLRNISSFTSSLVGTHYCMEITFSLSLGLLLNREYNTFRTYLVA